MPIASLVCLGCPKQDLNNDNINRHANEQRENVLGTYA